MARDRGQYKAGDRVSFRISKDVDAETLAHINSIENFSEETYILWRDSAKICKMKELVFKHEERFHSNDANYPKKECDCEGCKKE